MQSFYQAWLLLEMGIRCTSNHPISNERISHSTRFRHICFKPKSFGESYEIKLLKRSYENSRRIDHFYEIKICKDRNFKNR
jgi:hypothetical protein